ncbi:MAG: GlsB/YeaQ/YmgE family stress response membrane protein [Pseudoxanthomonas sp.]|nr:GlsB/YeaQ/YmgE family stress response membrane protein [Pseudoxanthomonas sp.]
MESLLGSTSWLYIIFIGLIVGVLARLLKPGKDSMGFFLTILLGIGGAALASWAGQSLGWYEPGEAAGFFGALIGAVVVLFVAGLFRGKKRHTLPPR